MEIDIKRKIKEDFDSDYNEVSLLLENLKNSYKFSDRVIRCVVFLSKGKIKILKKVIKRTEDDYRDIIIEAESYDFEFNLPFKFDISQSSSEQ
jgi:hypothetical protein